MAHLEIKDPVFAAYLLSKGCELKDIEPQSRAGPKRYLFDEAVKEEPYEAQFLGHNCPRELIAWRDFVTHMGRLIRLEDLKLRQMSDRPNQTGWEVHRGKKVFITTDQAIAAFILSHSDKKKIITIGVQFLGRDKGCKFIFDDPNGWADRSIPRMLEGDNFIDTWWEMKCSYKLATSLRRRIIRNLTDL